MVPSNDSAISIVSGVGSESSVKYFDLSNGNFSVKGVPLLSEVPGNVTFSPFFVPQSSNAPPQLLQRVQSMSYKCGFFGFSKEERSDRLKNSLGKFSDRNFLSIFRFKTWWSTMWVGTSGSDLQMETQWVLLDVPEIRSYVLILPLIEGFFRSALEPGVDGHTMICVESGSSQVKASTFDAIAYVHVSENPYHLMKEAYSAARVHLNTFRLLEEKGLPPLMNKFGWCTWDAFYLTVDPIGVWHGVKELSEGGVPPRFLIIDDGWQSINIDGDNPTEDAENLVLGGTQMTARLHRFEECKKFRSYQGGLMLGPNAPPFDPKRPKMLIAKAVEVEHAEKARDKAINSGVIDLSSFDLKIEELKKELNELLVGGENSTSSGSCGSCCCKIKNSGMKAFTTDLRTKFKGLDDIYVWHALCGAWGGVRPGSTHLNSKITPVKVSPGLDGTMTDLAVVKIVEGGIGLVHPDQADDFYDSMHSHLNKVGITRLM